MLQSNGRDTLTNIAKKVGLSVDTVSARINRLMKRGVISKIGAWIDPKVAGFPLVIDVKIRLQNMTEPDFNKFIAYLRNHKRVIELISVSGDFDLTCVLIAKDANELEKISLEIRQKFGHIIAELKGIIVLKVYKFEEYDFSDIIK